MHQTVTESVRGGWGNRHLARLEQITNIVQDVLARGSSVVLPALKGGDHSVNANATKPKDATSKIEEIWSLIAMSALIGEIGTRTESK